MCDMLMSVTDGSLLEQLEKDVTAISDAMLSFPVMIPGTRYYQGMKVGLQLARFSPPISSPLLGDPASGYRGCSCRQNNRWGGCGKKISLTF